MNYVVLDLEWNQCPRGKEYENKRLPFEIIEIGAVKLSESLEWLDEFHAVIRPRVYRTLHYRTSEVVQLNNRTLRGGDAFPDVARDFINWSGGAHFCTWGGSDLTELQRNLKFYHLLALLPGPFYYYDVQALFSAAQGEPGKRRSLEHAIDTLQIEKKLEFHSAMADAAYTAKILQALGKEALPGNESIDFFQNPKTKTDEIFLAHRTYSQFISCEFRDAEAAMRDQEVRRIYCYRCGRHARKKVLWFSAGGHRHQCVAWCPEHGLLEGVIHLRKATDGAVFAEKIVKSCSEAEAAHIRERKNALTERRRRRRREGARRMHAAM